MPGLMGKKIIILINNMRRHLFMLFCLLMVSSVSWADDCAKLGFKGKVKEVRYYVDSDSEVFKEPRQVANTKFPLWQLALPVGGYYHFFNIQSTSTGYTTHDGSCTLTLGKYGIAKAVYKSGKYTYTNLYTYDQNGNLTKINITMSWEEEITLIIPGSDKKSNNLRNKAFDAMDRGDWAAYWRISEQADRAAQPSYKTKKEKKSENYEVLYTYEKFDEVGNWTTRTYRSSRRNASTREYARWVYDEDFLAEFLWNKNVVPTMDVDSIENFYSKTESKKYKELAKKEWNSRIFEALRKKSNASLDQYAALLFKPIASEDSRSRARNYIGEQVCQNDAMAERDYAKVMQLAEMKKDYVTLIPEIYRNKILERAEQLRKDSVATLMDGAKASLEQKLYADCSNAARMVLSIDPENQEAAEYAAESEYRMLQGKVEAKDVAENDFALYLESNPTSKYTQNVQNARALIASSQLSWLSNSAELERVRTLPMDERTSKIVQRRVKHQHFVNHRGKFFHAGVTGFGSIDKGFYGYGGGVSMRFGWLLAWLNGFADVEVEHLDNRTKKAKLDGCVMKGNRLNVPFGLRLNVVRDSDFATFVSVGAQYSMPLGAKISGTLGEDAYKISDKNIFNKNNIIPRVGFGIATTHFELELYGLYETGKGVVNRSYVEGNTEYMNILDPVVVDKQFKSKIHGGLTFRLLFGK